MDGCRSHTVSVLIRLSKVHVGSCVVPACAGCLFLPCKVERRLFSRCLQHHLSSSQGFGMLYGHTARYRVAQQAQLSRVHWNIARPTTQRRHSCAIRASADDAGVEFSPALRSLVERLPSITDTNQLQTALQAALKGEDYILAAKLRDRLKEVMGAAAPRIDWGALDLPEWISDRVERLGFKFPSEVQRRAAPVVMSGLDAVIQSETGSGKTLSFLVPMLASLQYPPDIFLDELQGPQAVVVVPTLELGVQCALTVFKLLGGNISKRMPGDQANIFTYSGPRNILVRGLLNKEEVAMAKGTGYLKGVHVVVGTPAAIMDVYSGLDRKPMLDFLKMLVIDEYDECMRAAPEATSMLLSCACQNNMLIRNKPQVVLVGATITKGHIDVAANAKWIKEPVVIKLGDENSIPSALIHRYVVCEEGRRLAVLTRLLRQDLQDMADDPQSPARAMVFANTPEDAANATEPLRSALWGEHQMAVLLPPGTRIPPPAGSAPDEGLSQDQEEEKAAARHELAGSSPFSASDPIRAMHSFRDNRTSLLLCAPQAARGLDLPAVSHVYNLGLPPDSTHYLHRAGRAGRIGSTSGGIITTLVTPDELEALQAMASKLGISVAQAEAPDSVSNLLTADQVESSNVDQLRQGLEDLYNLM